MRRNRRAFTLAELLIVIGIIGVLLALLLPVVGMARRSARDTVCLANLHTWGVAFQAHQTNSGGRSVNVRTDVTDLTWFEQLQPYVGDVTRPLLCPAAAVAGNVLGAATLAWGPDRTYAVGRPVWHVRGTYVGSYGFNDWLGRLPAGADDAPPFSGYRIKLPARGSADVPVVVDGVLQSGLPLASDPVPTDLKSPFAEAGSGPAGVGGSMRYFCIDRHRRRVNALMLDGHAEAVPLPRLWRLQWHAGFVGRDVVVGR